MKQTLYEYAMLRHKKATVIREKATSTLHAGTHRASKVACSLPTRTDRGHLQATRRGREDMGCRCSGGV